VDKIEVWPTHCKRKLLWYTVYAEQFHCV
jgi:hypothetical protein